MENFLTILATFGIVISLLQIGQCFSAMGTPEVRLAEAMGMNPVGKQARKAILLFLVSAAWLLSLLF